MIEEYEKINELMNDMQFAIIDTILPNIDKEGYDRVISAPYDSAGTAFLVASFARSYLASMGIETKSTHFSKVDSKHVFAFVAYDKKAISRIVVKEARQALFVELLKGVSVVYAVLIILALCGVQF